MQAVILLLSSNRGVYIPQHFAQDEQLTAEFGFASDDPDITLLKSENALDDEWYWEAWNNVLDKAVSTKGYTLHQDEDLWAVHVANMSNEEYQHMFCEMKPCSEGWLEYAVCQDCLLYVANGDLPTDSLDWTSEGIDALPNPVADGAEYGFQHSNCECCGALAGDRFRVLAAEDMYGTEEPVPDNPWGIA